MKTVKLKIPAGSARPRVYRRMVGDVERGTNRGDVVKILDKHGEEVGQGFYNGQSEISVRVLTRSSDETIDDGWFRRRIESAVRLRRDVLGLDRVTDAYRVFHAEGDGIPGLIIDRYGDLLSAEVSVYGTFRRMAVIKEALRSAFRFRAIAVRDEPRYAKREGFRIPPVPPGPEWRTVFTEHGARFEVDVAGGHKTGSFLDQRDTRRAFAALCRGRRVLDLFCHSGGFGIHAALTGGARRVRCVDLDEAAIEQAKANVARNSVEVEVVRADAFAALRGTGSGEFDALVLDPPKLVRGKNDRGQGLNRYLDLNRLALGVLEPGALFLTCSCSGLVDESTFLESIRRAARAAGKGLRILRIAGATPDHPVDPEVVESRYLKTVLAQVL